jgi:hypothetical protein
MNKPTTGYADSVYLMFPTGYSTLPPFFGRSEFAYFWANAHTILEARRGKRAYDSWGKERTTSASVMLEDWVDVGRGQYNPSESAFAKLEWCTFQTQ